MAAKHILLARSEGAEAGMEAWLAAPSTKIHANYKTVMRKRTHATRLAAYCNLFADQIGQAVVQDTPIVGDQEPDMAAIVAAVVAAMQGQGNAPVVEAEVVNTGFITRIQAWEAGGADPKFAPKNDPDEPANNGQLYRLNMMGKLTDGTFTN